MDAVRPAPPAAAPAAGDERIWFGLRRKWWVLAVAMPSVVISELAFTTLMFSSVQVLQGIHADAFAYQWATGPYIVCLVMLSLLSVRLAQTFGSRRTYLAGGALAAAGCLLAAAAVSLPGMVIARLLLSGKALLLAVTLSQLWLVFPRRKGLAMAAYSAAMYGGLFVGAALGGFLEFRTSWRGLFVAAGLVYALLAAAGFYTLVRDRPADPPPLKFNGTEVTLLTAIFGAAVFLILRGGYFGWLDSNLVAAAIVLGVGASAAFLWVAWGTRDPLVSLRLREFPTLAVTLAVIGIFSGSVLGVLNTLPAYLALYGYPGTTQGWILLPPGVLIAASCLATGFAYGHRAMVLLTWAGLALNLAAGLWLMQADLYTSRHMLVAMLSLWAVGAGLVLPAALRLTFAGQTPQAVRRLAGAKVALRFAATIVGAFAVTVVIQRGTDTAQDRLRQGITPGNVAHASAVARVAQHAQARGNPPARAAEQAGSIVGGRVAQHAQWRGMQAGWRYLAGLTGLALAIALLLRLRTEGSILADDVHDLEWHYGHRAPPGAQGRPG